MKPEQLIGNCSVEEIKNFLRENGDVRLVISCRLAGPLPALTGYEKGYWCGGCRRELQVSPNGRKQLSAGGIPLCNSCALVFAEIKQEQGSLEFAGVTPDAAAAISGASKEDRERYEKLTGQKFRAPLTCDFCSAQPPGLWMFPHSEFTISADVLLPILGYERGEWGACDACAQLFERERLESMIERARVGMGVTDPAQSERLGQFLRIAYGTLLLHRTGPPRWQPNEDHAHATAPR